MKKCLFAICFVCAAMCSARAETITCGGDGPLHLQGVACDGEAIYWCFTTRLVKTDLTGARRAGGSSWMSIRAAR